MIRQREETSLKHISTVARESHRVGLYTLRKSEYSTCLKPVRRQ